MCTRESWTHWIMLIDVVFAVKHQKCFLLYFGIPGFIVKNTEHEDHTNVLYVLFS